MAIAFVQTANSGAPTGVAATVAATFASAQTAGNLNVVVISFGHAVYVGSPAIGTVSSVTDTQGNTYQIATTLSTFTSTAGDVVGCQIYYAPTIAAAAAGNIVTVNFSEAQSAYFIVGILEYSGLTGVVDVTALATANQPSSTTGSVGPVTSTNVNDLVVGAFVMFDGPVASGSGYTQRISVYTLLVEDKIVSATGAQTATATSGGTSGWDAQLVAFKGSTTGIAQLGSDTIGAGRTVVASGSLNKGATDTVAAKIGAVATAKATHGASVTI
jgi:hypothetical protein